MLLTLLNRLTAALAWVLRKPHVQAHIVRGFPVLLTNTRTDISSSAVIERFGEALDLIERYQPTRFAHLQRDVKAFRIAREAHRGHYQRTDGTVLTELTFLARRDIGAAVVASSILHEGVHARVHRFAPKVAGVHPGREERLCRKAELWFGEALPTALGEPVLQRARVALACDDDDLWVASAPDERRAAIARADEAAARGAS